MIESKELQHRLEIIFGEYNNTLNNYLINEEDLCSKYLGNNSNNSNKKITLLKRKMFNDKKIFTLRNELFNEDIPALSVDEFLDIYGENSIEELFDLLINYTQEDIDMEISRYILIKILGKNNQTNRQKKRNLEFIIQKFLEMNIHVSTMNSIVTKLNQLKNDDIIQCSLQIIINILKQSVGIDEEKILEIIDNFLDLNDAFINKNLLETLKYLLDNSNNTNFRTEYVENKYFSIKNVNLRQFTKLQNNSNIYQIDGKYYYKHNQHLCPLGSEYIDFLRKLNHWKHGSGFRNKMNYNTYKSKILDYYYFYYCLINLLNDALNAFNNFDSIMNQNAMNENSIDEIMKLYNTFVKICIKFGYTFDSLNVYIQDFLERMKLKYYRKLILKVLDKYSYGLTYKNFPIDNIFELLEKIYNHIYTISQEVKPWNVDEKIRLYSLYNQLSSQSLSSEYRLFSICFDLIEKNKLDDLYRNFERLFFSNLRIKINTLTSRGGNKKKYVKLQKGGKRLIHYGPKGGKYYIKGGRKFYIK